MSHVISITDEGYQLFHLYKTAFQLCYEISLMDLPQSEKMKVIRDVLSAAQREVEHITSSSLYTSDETRLVKWCDACHEENPLVIEHCLECKSRLSVAISRPYTPDTVQILMQRSFGKRR